MDKQQKNNVLENLTSSELKIKKQLQDQKKEWMNLTLELNK